MTVLAIFKYEVKPGRFDDFVAKLQAAADPRFNSPVMPQSMRLFRSPGPVILIIEFPIWPRIERARLSKTPIQSGRHYSPRSQIHP